MRALSLAVVFAGALVLAFPTGSDSCSIAPPVPVFSTAQRPADVADFVKGRIGVIRPSYQRRYLIAAYRTLSAKPLAPNDAEGLLRPSAPAQAGTSDITPAWTQVRAKVGVSGAPYIGAYKNKTGNGSFVFYPNCLNDAFDSALQTFQKRAAQWGGNDPRLRDWVAAQDQVFANCSGKDPVIPAAPAPGADPLLASDRRYQIAAAYFYAADWQKARDAFQLVAQDASSEWKDIAPYLIARTFIREGTVDDNPEALREAARRLQSILDDPALQVWHEPSRKLLDYVRLRIDPAPRLSELGAELTGARPSTNLAQATADFLYLFNRQTDKPGTDTTRLAASSDLADWMVTFEGHSKDAGAHALAQWQKTKGSAWLIAALLYTHDSEAIRAARYTDPNAPEYEAATYYGILADPDRPDARTWADEALSRQLLLSSRNLILEQRLTLARDWTEFLRFAPRAPEPKLQSFDGGEEDIDKPPVATGTAPLFDADAATVLNLKAPFSRWADASTNSLLPAHLQLQIAEAAWVRALVLGKDGESRALMERIVKLHPAFEATAHDFLASSDARAARFSGIFLLLRTPSLTAFLDPGEAGADLNQVSHLGSISWGFASGCLPTDPVLPQTKPEYLDAAQQAENDAEWKQMAAVAPSGGSYLAARVMAWATSHPDDPRLPEALHLVVQAGRRACRTPGESVTYGRAAFRILHRRYPGSEWSQKTKYWYE